MQVRGMEGQQEVLLEPLLTEDLVKGLLEVMLAEDQLRVLLVENLLGLKGFFCLINNFKYLMKKNMNFRAGNLQIRSPTRRSNK